MSSVSDPIANVLYGQWLAGAPRTMADVRRVLEALHGRYVMGWSRVRARTISTSFMPRPGLLRYFDFVLTAADFQRVKPDPEPYLRAVERSGFAASECLAIEDSARGLEAALARRRSVRCRPDPAHPRVPVPRRRPRVAVSRRPASAPLILA